VRKTPAHDIIEFLSFSSAHEDGLTRLSGFRQREWKQALTWLDDTGLAFYFLQKITDLHVTDSLPPWVLSRLERNFAANRERVGYMTQRFDSLNRRFDDAGIRYAVLKGHSLVPDFCPDACLRYQADFDYLVEETSLQRAKEVVVEAGYSPKPWASESSQEYIFLTPETENKSRDPDQYSVRAGHAVELHLDIWDADQFGLPSIPKLFSVDRTRTQRWNGLSFPVLSNEDAFLIQVLHASHHLFTYWLRMSCLFEIAFFLNHRASDTSLWNKVEHTIGDNLMLKEFAVLITELAAGLFTAPIPQRIRVWGEQIRPATRVWIENYAQQCAFYEVPSYELSLLPRAKLVLFLQQQYDCASVPKNAVRNRLMRFSRFSRMASSIKAEPFLILKRSWWKRHLPLRRSLFHILSGIRYFCEIPRWHWLNRAANRSLRFSE
jgi:hypothetical protein